MNGKQKNSLGIALEFFVLFFLLSQPVQAVVYIHTAYGKAQYDGGAYPAALTFQATITARPGDILTQSSSGCSYNAPSGVWVVQCASFATQPAAGEVLRILLNDGAGGTGTDEMTLTNDPYDNAGTTVLTVPVVNHQITIASGTPNRTFQADGETYTGSHVFTWQEGSSHTLNVASPQSGESGVRYVFQSWSDGGALSHSYTVPTSDAAVTVYFSTQYALAVNSPRGNPQGAEWYGSGATANFSVTSPVEDGNTRYVFLNWSGSASGSSPSGSIVMNEPKAVTANWKTQYKLSCAVNPSGGGTMTPAPPGGFYDSGTVVSVNAAVASGYRWYRWSGALTDTIRPGNVTMTGPKSLTALFAVIPTTVQVYVGTSPAGRGFTVDGISYTSGQTFNWVPGSTHNLSVSSPQSGETGVQYIFLNWRDGGSQSHSYVVPETNQEVVAAFKTQYKLTTAVNPSGGGTMTPAPPGGFYDSGTVVSVNAAVASGYRWYRWSGALTDTIRPGNVTMTGPKSLTALFAVIPTTVQITVQGYPTGKAFVVDDTSYTAAHVFNWAPGSTHRLSVVSPQSGETGVRYIYYGWNDGGAQSHTYTVPGNNATVTAYFTTQYKLTTGVSPEGGGSMTPAPPGEYYNSGTVVSVNAAAASGYRWYRWSGALTDTVRPESVTMNEPKSLTALFATIPTTVQITVQTYPTGKSFVVDEITCTASQTFNWVPGSAHNLSVPSPQSGETGTRFVFQSWSDGGAQSHSYAVPETNRELIVTFKTQYKLSCAVNPSGGGTMTPAPPGGFYDSGTVVSVNAAVASGYRWYRWSGALTDTARPGNVTLNEPKSVTANFSTISGTVQITIQTSPSGKQFKVNGTAYTSSAVFSWTPGSEYTLSVESPQHMSEGSKWVYDHWNDGGAQNHTYAVPSSNATVQVIFKCMYQLTVNSSCGNPQGSGWYDSGTTANFSVSSPVEQENSRYIFVNWSGGSDGTSPSGSIVMNGAKSVTANWRAQYRLSCAVNPSGGGSMTPAPPGGFYDYGTSVQLNAEPASGYQWAGWSGDLTGTPKPKSITMTNPKTVTANFSITSGAVQITIQTSPSGKQFTVNGTAYTTSAVFNWVPGAQYTLSVESPQHVSGESEWVFAEWTDGGAQTHTYTVPSANATVIARFGSMYRLSVHSPYGNPQGEGWYHSGETAAFSVTTPVEGENKRHLFLNWSGSADGISPSGSLVMNEPKSVTANWKTQYWLSCAVNPASGGSMTPPAPGDWRDAGSTVSVSASTNSGYAWQSWSGDLSGTNNPAHLTMSGPKTVVANFSETFSCRVTTDPPGLSILVDGSSYTAPCDFPWAVGTVHSIGTDSIIPAGKGSRYVHQSWSDKGTRIHNVTAGAAMLYEAHFSGQAYLSVSTNPDTGGILVPPPPGGWFEKGSTITLYAVPNVLKGFMFTGWTGDHIGTSDPDTVLMNGPRQITANFSIQTFTIHIQIEPTGSGSVIRIPEKSGYYFSEMVQVKAVPHVGFGFDFWSGDAVGAVNPTTIIITGNKTATVHFKSAATGIDRSPEERVAPLAFGLEQNYPNPFNPETSIRFHIPESGPVILRIYNTLGERIRTLLNEFRASGSYQAVWDGRTDYGREAGAGTYVIVLSSGGRIHKTKAVFMK